MEKSKKVKAPTKNAEPAALAKYFKWKKLYKYYMLKKEIGVEPFNAGHETKLQRAKLRMNKARKLAAPLLIQKLRAKRSAIGKGKKRGGIGGNLTRLK